MEIIPVDTKVEVMNKVGATRANSWHVVAKALWADKMTVDKNGEEHIEADHAIRLRAAELIARANGDIKPDGAISVTNNTINIGNEGIKKLIDMANDVKEQIASLKGSGRQTGEIIDV